MTNMNIHDTTLLLIGFQNDYFSADGILRPVVEESSRLNNTVTNTLELLRSLEAMGNLPRIVATPIVFTEDYREIDANPIGILHSIQQLGAFRANHSGSETIDELKQFGDRIHYLPGKHGLNAFSNTDLHPFLIDTSTKNLVLAGAVTSICIDSTGRAAYELGFKVTVLSNCTSARTAFEQEYFCRNIFPLYSQVLTHSELLNQLRNQDGG